MSGIKQPVLKYDFSKLKEGEDYLYIEDLVGDNKLELCAFIDSFEICEEVINDKKNKLNPLPVYLYDDIDNVGKIAGYLNNNISGISLKTEFTIYMELDLIISSKKEVGIFNIDYYLRLKYNGNTITFVNDTLQPQKIITFTVDTSATYKTLILTGKNGEKPKLYLDGKEHVGDNDCNLSTKIINKLEIGIYTGGYVPTNYYFTGKIYSFELYDYDISTDSNFDQWLLINTAKNKSIKDLNLEDLYVLNELNKEYERQMDTKQNIAKKEENYYKYKKGNEDLVFRIGFYRNYGNILKKTTIVVHFVLIAIILIIMVYRVA